MVLEDPSFESAPGGAKHHHNYAGGLAEHTLEVALTAESMTQGAEQVQAIVGTIFHDVGKLREYILNPDGSISVTPFCSRIGHVTWGFHVFTNAAEMRGFAPAWIEEIGHALLAHHGRFEWHSPVEPQTRLALVLHTADMVSMKGAAK